MEQRTKTTHINLTPHVGDGSRTKAVLMEIRLGRLKGPLAKRLLQQARCDDAKAGAP